MQQLTLNGDWTLSSNALEMAIPATVPGCVHMDLLANHLLEDPFYRDNEQKQFWIGETDWTYTREFTVPDDLLAHDTVLLRCHGLDTLATLTLNGQAIAQTENMYRTYEFDVKSLLVAGTNTLTVFFASPMNYVNKMDAERGVLYAWSIGEHRLNGGGWIRKEPSNFGWDWGPQLVTSGIWRNIELLAFDSARIADVLILQNHHEYTVTLDINATIDVTQDRSLSAKVEVQYEGKTIVQIADVPVSDGKINTTLQIENPALWFPNGMGEQPLYTVTIILHDNDTEIDRAQKSIGLRTLKLERHADEWGESFYFSANGDPFFAKGANWIPADVFVARLTAEDYELLIKAAVDANMNMLRVWGGGIYEADVFYDLCDQYGITVWQDFMFACGTYPAFDDDFMANVRAEAVDNVKRIRHHACMALWCGNNELEQGLAGDDYPERQMSWADYGKLFDELLANVVKEYDPQRDYVPGSPHTPTGDRNFWQNQGSGDTHLWEVWHGKQPFEWYRTRQDRFVSEFGFQSFPDPAIVETFTEPEDRNITSYVMEYHQRSGIGNSTIIHYMLDWFRLPSSYEYTIWLSQILQALAMKFAIEGWRRNMPRQMGALYWQLNDLWPAPSWSSLDWKGNWKALQHYARRFFAPELVSAVANADAQTVEIYVTHEFGKAQSATVNWTVMTVDGQTISSGERSYVPPQNASQLIEVLDLADALRTYGERNLLVWLSLDVDGNTVSENLEMFARPKHMPLCPPGIETIITQIDEGVYDVSLRASVPALYVWLELPGAVFSDNFVHLRPNVAQMIRVHAPDLSTLRVKSLYDTYQ